MKLDGHKDLFSWRSRFQRFRRDNNRWSVLTLVIVFFIAFPIVTIGVKLFSEPGKTWSHIHRHLLSEYVLNSLFLFALCGILGLVLGVSSAWLFSRYDFFMSDRKSTRL